MELMKSARLYHCVRCRDQCIICSDCDRGNIYCGHACASCSRIQNHRISNQKYQKTFRGAQKHAVRQRNYRLRQKKIVTDEGSTETPANDLLPSLKNDTQCKLKNVMRCDFCHAPVSDFFHNGYLRHPRNKNRMLNNDRNAQGP